MNILFFLRKFPTFGGVEKITITLASALQREGFNVSIISEKGEANELLYELDSNIKCYFFLRERLCSRDNMNQFISVLRANKIDCILNQGCYPDMNLFLKRICAKIDVPIISILHNDPLSPIKDIERNINADSWKAFVKKILSPVYVKWIYYLTKKNYKMITSYSKKIVLLSDSFRKEFRELSNCHNSNIEVIPNCFNFVPYNDVPSKEKIILYVGRVIEEQKRVSRLIKIWKSLYLRFPEWKLVIVGDGPDSILLKRAVREGNISRTEFTGFRKDVSSYMKRASIILLVSDFEGFPMTLVEAMRERCVPVVYGTYSAAYDLITDNSSGFIIPPLDQECYERRLAELMKNEQKLKEMREASYNATENYDIKLILPLWKKLLKAIKMR